MSINLHAKIWRFQAWGGFLLPHRWRALVPAGDWFLGEHHVSGTFDWLGFHAGFQWNR